jgi:hypothetical protein
MNIFEGAELNTMQFIWPLVILIGTMFGTTLIYALCFKWLPKKLYNFFIGPAALLGFYIWLVPFNLGFYIYFSTL